MKKKSVTRRKSKLSKIKILVLHGPNLNLLGEREPEIYGMLTLKELNKKIGAVARTLNVELKTFQANGEGAIIDFIHKHRKWAQGLIFNPGAYTHYSYAIRDAVAGAMIPTIEVHLSDIHQREDFRKISVVAPVCIKQISGLGLNSYLQALQELVERQNAR